MIAMTLAGVNVERYVAYEIDKYAVKTATHNFPIIEEKGDVFKADFTEYRGFDWLVGGSPCFTKGHLVLTDKGYKDVSEIAIGDYVLTHTGEYHKVIRTNKREAPTVKVDVMGYPTFTTTAEHPFYTLQKRKATWAEYKQNNSWRMFSDKPEWTKAKDLTINHFCGQHILGAATDMEISHEDLWLFGRYVADGHIRKEKRKGRKDSYQYQMIISVGKDKADTFKRLVTHTHYSFFPHTQSTYRAVFSSMEYVNFIIDNNFGRTASEKRIPEFIFKLPITKKRSFLDGYLSGDGCFSQGKWTACTTSKELAYGLQRLATSIYNTNVSVTVSEPRKETHTIDGRVIKQNFPLYSIIIPTEIKKQSVCHIQNDIVWTQVKSVRDGSVETVYNIEVEGDNSYTINNLIVHNCTYWSIAQTKNRETTASGMGWELFSQYVRALKEAQPKYFIYENNKSMSSAIRQSITEAFGFEPICINSALVSAQSRQRLYWVGIRRADGTYRKAHIEQPKDRGILLPDILEMRGGWICENNKAYCLCGKHTGNMRDYIKKSQTNIAFKKIEPVIVAERGRYDESGKVYQHFEANEDSKSNVLTTVQKDNLVAEPIRVGEMPNKFGKRSTSQGQRIYSAEGKAVPINTGQTKTGFYSIKMPECFRVKEATAKGYTEIEGGQCVDMSMINSKTRRGRKMEDKSNCLQTSCEFYQYCGTVKAPIYEVKNGMITVKGKQYPIKLVDGYYIIRKLTVRECMRLQTVPEWYDFSCVSNTQAYKMLGNGWTCEVIKHLILSALADTEEAAEEKEQMDIFDFIGE